jgi:hypothetical protein
VLHRSDGEERDRRIVCPWVMWQPRSGVVVAKGGGIMGAYRVGLAATALACGLAQAAAADLPMVAKAPPAIAAGEGGFWIGGNFFTGPPGATDCRRW